MGERDTPLPPSRRFMATAVLGLSVSKAKLPTQDALFMVVCLWQKV